MAKNKLINARAYDWNSIDIAVPGMQNIEITDISYGSKQEEEAVYGKGGDPRGYGTGNHSSDVTVSMSREDFNEYCRVLKKNGVKRLFNYVIPKITVSFANEEEKTTTDIINKVKFSETSFKAAQGDKTLKVELKGTAYGGVKYNGLRA